MDPNKKYKWIVGSTSIIDFKQQDLKMNTPILFASHKISSDNEDEGPCIILATVVSSETIHHTIKVNSIALVKGEKGDQGPQGPKGEQGSIGPEGPQGADSTVPGPEGKPGVNGKSFKAITVTDPEHYPWYVGREVSIVTSDTVEIGDVVAFSNIDIKNPGSKERVIILGEIVQVPSEGENLTSVKVKSIADNIQGPKGEKGDLGPEGPVGPRGFTWYPIIAENGDITWVEDNTSTVPPKANIRGPKGDRGEAGPQGPAGPTGGEEPENLWSLKKSIILEEYADLNYLIHPGTWRVPSNAIARNIKNLPEGVLACSIVNFSYTGDTGNNMLTQFVYPLEGGLFMRSKENWGANIWTVWKDVSDGYNLLGRQKWGNTLIPMGQQLEYNYRKNIDNKCPLTGWGSGMLDMAFADKYGAQVAFGQGDAEIAIRNCTNSNTWSNWYRVLTQLNGVMTDNIPVLEGNEDLDSLIIAGMWKCNKDHGTEFTSLPPNTNGTEFFIINFLDRYSKGSQPNIEQVYFDLADNVYIRRRQGWDRKWLPWKKITTGDDLSAGTICLENDKYSSKLPMDYRNSLTLKNIKNTNLGIPSPNWGSVVLTAVSDAYANQVAFAEDGNIQYRFGGFGGGGNNTWKKWHKLALEDGTIKHSDESNVLNYFNWDKHPLPLPRTCRGMQYQLASNIDISIPKLNDGDKTYWSLVVSIQKWGDKSGGSPIQLAIQDDGKVFFRMGDFTANTWGEWSRYLKDDDALLLKGIHQIGLEEDLNNYNKPGTSQISSYKIGETIQNLPKNADKAGTIIFLGYSIKSNEEWQGTQFYIDLSGKVFTRGYYGYRADPNTRWGHWQAVGGVSEISYYKKDEVTISTIDNFVTAGRYTTNTDKWAKYLKAGRNEIGTQCGFVEVDVCSNNIIQSITLPLVYDGPINVSRVVKWSRFKYGKNNWSSWELDTPLR